MLLVERTHEEDHSPDRNNDQHSWAFRAKHNHGYGTTRKAFKNLKTTMNLQAISMAVRQEEHKLITGLVKTACSLLNSFNCLQTAKGLITRSPPLMVSRFQRKCVYGLHNRQGYLNIVVIRQWVESGGHFDKTFANRSDFNAHTFCTFTRCS